MTLPFRRRHHDAESSHDRARSLWSAAMLEPIEADDEAWLQGHLLACAECRLDHERYVADRELLRSLRVEPPQPPRDLWARTAAAIEGERTRAARGGLSVLPGIPGLTRAAGGPFRRVPAGIVSGLLVVLVVVGAALVSRPNVIPPLETPGPTDVALGSVEPAPTPLLVTAADVLWLRAGRDGSYEVVSAGVNQVCPDQRSGCPELEQSVQAPIKLGGRPIGVTVSPVRDEFVVISAADEGVPAKIVVIPVPERTPAASPTPAPTATEGPTLPTTPAPTDTPIVTPSEGPTTSPTPVATEPGPEPTPEGAVEIASGIVVVGDALYSHDGQWLAFSARPSDLSTGPDLYLWHAGTPAAVAVTSDHRTYVSSWLGDQVLASRVELDTPVAAEPTAEPTPEALDEPSPPSSADPTDVASPEPPTEGHAVSFLLDPATLAITDLAEPNVWLPVVDPTSRLVVYWSGTVAPSDDGTDWRPAVGQVVLARWTGTEAEPVESLVPSTEPSAEPTASEPTASEPVSSPGPAGEPFVLAEGPIAAFDARFDPDGQHLGLWTLEGAEDDHGRLQLIVLDPETGSVDQTVEPLQGEPALPGFSINEGRLAWVTPPGQDGRQSSVAVLAWHGREFGHVETIPAQELLVLR